MCKNQRYLTQSDFSLFYITQYSTVTKPSSHVKAVEIRTLPVTSLARHSALRKFKEFIRGFSGHKGDYPYRESLVHNPAYLSVAIEDLDAFDADLSDKLRKAPADYLPLFETTAAEILASLRSKVANETSEMEEPEIGDVQIFISSKESSVSMRSVGAEYMSKLVKIAGITIAASSVKAKAMYVTLMCKNCRSIKTVAC